MNKITLEIACESLPSAIAAEEAGADRIELCQALTLGGLSPSAGLIKLVKKHLKIPVFVLIRPRKGDFLYTKEEFEVMLEDIYAAKTLNADGIVSGCLNEEGMVDISKTQRLIQAASPLPFTFHRAFDMCKDPFVNIDSLCEIGVKRILSSGQRADALSGAANIKAFIKASGKRINFMAGGGLRSHNVFEILKKTNVKEIHASAKALVYSSMQYRGQATMGNEDLEKEFQWHEANAQMIKAIKQEIFRYEKLWESS